MYSWMLRWTQKLDRVFSFFNFSYTIKSSFVFLIKQMDKSKEAKYAITARYWIIRNKTNIYKTDKTDIYKIAFYI